jgi:hypothetical protein
MQNPKVFSHFINNNNFTTHVGAECIIEYSRSGFRRIAKKACDALLDEFPDANTAVVFTIVDQRTIYYVAKCKPNKICSVTNKIINMKEWPCPYPNIVGSECQIRGRVSGIEASKFLLMIGRYDLRNKIVLKQKIKLLQQN